MNSNLIYFNFKNFRIMKNRFFTLVCLLCGLLVSAQNITATYELSYKKNPKKEDITKVTCYLDLIGLESAFRTEDEKIADSMTIIAGIEKGIADTFHNSFYVTKNLASGKVYKNFIHSQMGDKFSIEVPEKMDWKLSPDTKKIDEFLCQKATTQYGGREWEAWFYTNYPYQDGPYVFRGLPGLIISIADTKGDYRFDLVAIKANSENPIFRIKNGKVISWKEYQKMLLSYYSDPYSHIKIQNMPVKAMDENGNPIKFDFKEFTEDLRKRIRESYNPIEIDKKVEFK